MEQMIQYTNRLAKRFAILLPGIVIAYLSVRNVFPYFDRRLPVALAVFVTYVLGAYVFVPALIRVYRIIRPPDHLPFYCVTPDGFASDPMNIGIIGTRKQLIQAMEHAGWYMADPHSFRNLIRHGLSIFLGWEYPNAPVSNLYLFGRRQDLAFEVPISGAGNRHHVRFWATTYEEGKQLAVHTIHWHNRNSRVRGDNLLWVGAASLDVGIAPIRHNLQLTHMIHPDTNRERELIVEQLQAQQLVKRSSSIQLGKPYRLMNRALTGYLNADGMMAVIWLSSRKP
jgi:hypothetical protein